MCSGCVRHWHPPVSLTVGLRYWVEEQDNGPEGLALRFVLTFLFPK